MGESQQTIETVARPKAKSKSALLLKLTSMMLSVRIFVINVLVALAIIVALCLMFLGYVGVKNDSYEYGIAPNGLPYVAAQKYEKPWWKF